MIGEHAPEGGIGDRRRADILRRRSGMRQTSEGGSEHCDTPDESGPNLRASCQTRARGATVVTMPNENFLSQVPAASALFLREEEVRRGIEYLFFGHGALWRAIDGRLAENDLGRAHYRALYFIARAPGITISDLLGLLGITKQSLGRVVKDLEAREFLTTRQGGRDRRQKELRLTPAGRAV